MRENIWKKAFSSLANTFQDCPQARHTPINILNTLAWNGSGYFLITLIRNKSVSGKKLPNLSVLAF